VIRWTKAVLCFVLCILSGCMPQYQTSNSSEFGSAQVKESRVKKVLDPNLFSYARLDSFDLDRNEELYRDLYSVRIDGNKVFNDVSTCLFWNRHVWHAWAENSAEYSLKTFEEVAQEATPPESVIFRIDLITTSEHGYDLLGYTSQLEFFLISTEADTIQTRYEPDVIQRAGKLEMEPSYSKIIYGQGFAVGFPADAITAQTTKLRVFVVSKQFKEQAHFTYALVRNPNQLSNRFNWPDMAEHNFEPGK